MECHPPAVVSPKLEHGVDAWARAGISRAYCYELLNRGRFPKPVKIGRAVRFVASEIDAWIIARIAERDGPNA
jgi:prophage regulatory protein